VSAAGRVEKDPVTGVGPLRVAVDGRVLQDRYHGIGRHTYELVGSPNATSS
jgi:hypothetical protein